MNGMSSTLDRAPGYMAVADTARVRSVVVFLATLAYANEVSIRWREIATPRSSLTSMRGVGAGAWGSEDAARHVRSLRDEWDR